MLIATLTVASFLLQVESAELTARQFYLQYHQKCLVVSSPKALLPWRSKDSIERDRVVSDEEIEQVYPMIKEMMPKNVLVIEEEIKGDRATLKVTGEIPDAASAEQGQAQGKSGAGKKRAAMNKPASKSEQAIGVVLLVKENGQWKMDHESWTSR